MSTQSDFRQITATQWETLSASLWLSLRAFNPDAAARFSFDLARAMDSNAKFRESLSAGFE